MRFAVEYEKEQRDELSRVVFARSTGPWLEFSLVLYLESCLFSFKAKYLRAKRGRLQLRLALFQLCNSSIRHQVIESAVQMRAIVSFSRSISTPLFLKYICSLVYNQKKKEQGESFNIYCACSIFSCCSHPDSIAPAATGCITTIQQAPALQTSSGSIWSCFNNVTVISALVSIVFLKIFRIHRNHIRVPRCKI